MTSAGVEPGTGSKGADLAKEDYNGTSDDLGSYSTSSDSPDISLDSQLPADVFTDTSIQSSPIEEFKVLKNEVIGSPNDIKHWDGLFQKFDELVTHSLNNDREISKDFKLLVYTSYEELLTRFPYLVSYWKQFSIMEYKLNGSSSSIGVLRKAVNSCQYSLDLWEDYLNALMVEKDPEFVTEVKSCLQLNGQNFNSHVIWDKYLAHIAQDNKSDNVFEVYLKLIRIPVYEYARYYDDYLQLDKFTLLTTIPAVDLEPYLHKIDKSDINDCTEVEKFQILQEFSEDIFQITQTRVTEKWEYESVIKNRELNLQAINDKYELDNWINYLDYEIKNGVHESIVNLFEQCLIPLCFNEKMWLKYLSYLNFSTHFSSPEESSSQFMIMDSIYARANNKFVPLDQNSTRLTYGKFLIKFDKLDIMHDYQLDLIRYFSGDNYMKVYFKGPYLSSIKALLENWQLMVSPDVTLFEELLMSLINLSTNNDKLRLHENITCKINEKYLNLLLKYLNGQAIPVLIQMYLNNYLLRNELTNEHITHLRKFFQKHYNKAYLKDSRDFWKFYLEFEGLAMYNLVNVNSIMNYIKLNTKLPILTINKFLKFQYDLFNANLSDFLSQLPNNDCLIKYDANCSVSLQNDHLVSRFNKLGLSKQLDYPGVKIDFKPDITNKLMNDGENFSILEDKVPGLPSFKNVEKVNASIQYPKEN